MASNDMAAVFETSAQPQPDLLLSATLHLMSQYTAQGGCVKLASVIERHLQALADLPGLTPVLAATCHALSEQWGQIVERSLPRAERSGLLSRLMPARRHAGP